MNANKTKTSFYIDKDLLKQMKMRCVLLEINQSEFIRQAIESELKKEIPEEVQIQKTIEEATGQEILYPKNENIKTYPLH